MNANRHGLGRGLGDLLQQTDLNSPCNQRRGTSGPAGARFGEIAVADIRPNPKQPRTVFDEDALAELVGSIQEVGLLQPVVVHVPSMTASTSWSWASAGFARPSRPASPRSRPSSAAPRRPTCSGTRCWRTCTVRNSTRWRKPPLTSRCSATSVHQDELSQRDQALTSANLEHDQAAPAAGVGAAPGGGVVGPGTHEQS